MATLKHKKLQEDAHREMLEESIRKILAQLENIENRLKQYEVETSSSTGKPKPKRGGRNV